MTSVYILAAKRTAVMPIQGGFNDVAAHDLVIPVINSVVQEAGIHKEQVDQVILGNALYGGGNVARVAALGAGLSLTTPAMTIDTQCCGGLDAIGLGSQLIKSGAADFVIAGGVESYSRSPKRLKRAMNSNERDEEYDRPPFTPWSDRDPDMLAAAAHLANEVGITQDMQHAFAINSHRKAMAYLDGGAQDIMPIKSLTKDGASRKLSNALCSRLPIIAGDKITGLTSASTALKADGAAVLLLGNAKAFHLLKAKSKFVAELTDHISIGSDPENPALAPISAINALLKRSGLKASEIAVTEMMEAFAVQAIICLQETGLYDRPYNLGGGALARGHPIGASGAINATRLFHELQKLPIGSHGLAAIAAAGGLGSAALMTSKA